MSCTLYFNAHPHPYCLCLWRLDRFDEAATVFTRTLWLNPSDNQDARFNLAYTREVKTWHVSANA
jgi:hypothetical protein